MSERNQTNYHKSVTKKKLKIIIERGPDTFGAYAEGVPFIYGQGDTVADTKKSVIESIDLFLKLNDEKAIPTILKNDYEIIFKFDVESFLNFYKKTFTNAALERMTGINQKQFQHYATGLKKPRPAQAKKIESAMHSLGQELLALEL